MADAKIEKNDIQVMVKNGKTGDEYSATKNEMITGGTYRFIRLRHNIDSRIKIADISIDTNYPSKKGRERILCCYMGNKKHPIGFSTEYPRGFCGMLPTVIGRNINTGKWVNWSKRVKIL